MENNYIKKKKIITLSKFSIELLSDLKPKVLKIFLMIYSVVNTWDYDFFPTFRFDRKEFMKILTSDCRMNSKPTLNQVLNLLCEAGYLELGWIHKSKSLIVCKIHDCLKNFCLRIRKNYIKFSLADILKFEKTSTIILYIILMQNKFMAEYRNTSNWYFKADQFMTYKLLYPDYNSKIAYELFKEDIETINEKTQYEVILKNYGIKNRLNFEIIDLIIVKKYLETENFLKKVLKK